MNKPVHLGFSALKGSRSVFVTVVLVGILLATWLTGKWDVSRIEKSDGSVVRNWQAEAFQQIEESVSEVFDDLARKSSLLASSESVLTGFDQYRQDPSSAELLVRSAADYVVEEHGFIEFYDPKPGLLSWKGPAFPVDAGISDEQFLSQPVQQVAHDGAKRTAFVVWQPVFEGDRAVGSIRMGTIVESYVPIKNEFLRDYSWDEEWSRKLLSTVDFTFSDRVEVVGENEWQLTSPLGTPLGKVFIAVPSIEDWAASKRVFYGHVIAFWIALILMWQIWVFTRYIWKHVENPIGDDSTPVVRAKPHILVYYGLYLVAARWAWLWLDVPSRWQTGKTPFAPLFDPKHLASVFGGGAVRTIGDLFISALFIALFCFVMLRATGWMREKTIASLHFGKKFKWDWRTLGVVALHTGLTIAIASFLFQLSSQTVQDSTLDYFARSGLLPDRLVLVVFGSLLLTVLAMIVCAGRLLWMVIHFTKADVSQMPSVGQVGLYYVLTGGIFGWIAIKMGVGAPLGIDALVVGAALLSAKLSPIQPVEKSPLVTLRHIVPIVVVTSMLLFPMLEISSNQKMQLQMKDAAISFLEDKDSRVMFAISQVLDSAMHGEFDAQLESLSDMEAAPKRARIDSLAEETASGLLLSALSGYDVTITIHSDNGLVLGRYSNLIRRIPRQTRDLADQSDFDLFLAMYGDFGSEGPMIEKLTGLADQNRFRYAGFLRIAESELEANGAVQEGDPAQSPYFYMLVRAEQRALTESAGTPFPKVLSPGSYYGNKYAELSVAEFKSGILIRSQGQSFGRSFLDEDVVSQIRGTPELWVDDTINERSYQTLYLAQESLDQGSNASVIAVRRRTTSFFDQLYHLLRIVVAGMFLSMPIYVGGVIWRIRTKQKGPQQRQFRDRVLNAFFSVGIITVFAMGFVGLRVVTGENERAIESWLRQHLDRVEQTLQLETRGEELPYRVLDRISIDSLAARVGLDLIVYRGREVDQASRPELVRDRLIEQRLPIEAFQALYFDGFRFATVNEHLGSFAYTAGYRALTDERGVPHYVVSVPTLPEQERIEEERARTVAYLFGALLLLVLVVMVTASFLASALTRPIVQLRAGLQAVAAGHFERIALVDTRDEIADLVDSFNDMQDQLEESRKLVGQQERQLAWKEMARQVAHEIKNPLTPMKLSIQHLRNAFSRRSEDGSDNEKFSAKFNQTTTTLIEQIDALARIANEFSSFGRMPTHIREEVDLNTVIQEAVELMQAEENVVISMDLESGQHLVHADREALRRVYINFLKNAIQSVPEDRLAEVVVTSRRESIDGKAMIRSSVKDNGTGIPRHLWEKIFVPSFSTKTSGTGLGLAIARKTIENMDGEIGFETQFEEGTTFWLLVPLANPSTN